MLDQRDHAAVTDATGWPLRWNLGALHQIRQPSARRLYSTSPEELMMTAYKMARAMAIETVPKPCLSTP
jgi:hypothetical protein